MLLCTSTQALAHIPFMKQINKNHRTELLAVARKAAVNTRTLDLFLNDLLTPQEYADMVARWQIVKLLNQGVTQRVIARQLKVGIAKVSRGSRVLLDHKGGFQTFLNKSKNNYRV